jgi:type VI secretion system protein VasJ
MNLTELGKNPISEANPAGDDIRYEPEFDELQQEIDKLSIASADGGGIDWNRVISLSGTILAEKSKNMQVATYLAAALTATDQFQGLSDGLTIIKDLVENYWDTMYPPLKRIRGRLNAVAWWADRAEAFLKEYDPDPLPAELVDGAKNNLGELDNLLGDKSDDAPVLSRLQGLIERLPVQGGEDEPAESAPEPKAAPASDAPSEPPPQAAPAPPAERQPASEGEPASEQDASALLESGLNQLRQVADYYMGQDLSNPMPYRLTRISAWLTVDQTPMSDKNITPLPPPDAMVRTAIDGLVATKDWEGVVRACEARVGEFLFWLDMSRISAQALDELGGRYQAAQDALAAETAMYVNRLSGVENLCFSDGTPFADPETKAWLNSIAMGGGDGGAPVSAGDDASSQVADGFNQALELVKGKKVSQAVGLLEDHYAKSAAGKDRLMWRNALVRLLVRAGRPELALPHAKAILADIDGHHLETWDPVLALDSLLAVHQCLSPAGNEKNAETLEDITARIARISPRQALAL